MQNQPIIDTSASNHPANDATRLPLRGQAGCKENENIIMEESFPRPLRIRCAQCISNTLAPITISLPLVVVVAFYHARNLFAALSYALITLFFVSLAPATYVLIGLRQGKISDLEVSNRKERTGPFLFGIMSTIVGLFILLFTDGPKNLETLVFITGLSGIVMTLTTLWWKISIHASSMAVAATLLATLYGIVMLPTYLLVVLVSWSRVALRRHTVAQVVIGALVSIVLTAAILKVRGV